MSECIILFLPLPPWSHHFLAVVIAVPPSIKYIGRPFLLLMPTYIAWCGVSSSHLLLLFFLLPSQYELVQTLFSCIASEFELYCLLPNMCLPLGWAKYFCQDDKISYTEPSRSSYHNLTIINLQEKHSLLEVLVMYTVFTKEKGLELWIISLECYHFSTREIQRIINME